jgi:ammonia channel protein AmtB
VTPARALFITGTLPYIVLGVAHALATPLHPGQRKGLSPADPAVTDAMERARVLLTGRTSLWLTWVGFNLSHSLGAAGLGALLLLGARSEASFAAQAGVLVPFAVLVGAAYLWLGVRYWFRTPIIGCALSFAAFLGSGAVLLAGGR